MTGILIKRGSLDIESCPEGKHHIKMKAESGVKASRSQGMPKISRKPPEARGEAGNQFSQPSEGVNQVNTLILDF